MVEWVTCRVYLQKTFTYKKCFLWLRWRQWALRTRMAAPPKHLHHNVALLTRWCLWRLGPTLGWDFDWTNPSDELIHHFLIFSFCALFNYFWSWCEMRKFDDWITLLHCSSKKRKKSATNLLPGVQESAEASESGIPFDLHMINLGDPAWVAPPKLAQRANGQKKRAKTGAKAKKSVVCFLARICEKQVK